MTKGKLRKMRKKKLLELAASEMLKLPDKILKPELVDKLYMHFKKKEAVGGGSAVSGKKRKTAASGKSARRKPGSAPRKKGRGKAAASGKDSQETEPEENGRTIRQKAVSGKYYLEKESGRVILKEEKYNLPSYDSTRIEAMVRDPNCIFAYWEISSGDVMKLADSLGPDWNNHRMVLRVYGIGEEGSRIHLFDIDIPGETDNWYLDVSPDSSYRIGLGFISPDGKYTEISLSGIVETPRESVCDYQDEKWARPRHLVDRILKASGNLYIKTGAGPGTSEISFGNPGSESVSSPGTGTSQRRETVLNAELVIRGVAGDDTTINLLNNEIVPGEDGSFSIRMELPDGEVEIPIKLLAPGGKIEKSIKTFINTSKPSGE